MKTLRVMALVIALAMVVAACAAEPAATTAAGGTATTAAGGTATTAAGGTATTAAGGTATTAGGTGTTATAGGETPYEHLNQAYAGEFEGTEVVISAQWIEAEEDSFNAALQPFRDATGIDVVYEPLTDYETALQTRVDGGDPPDLAQIAQPGVMQRYASEGTALPLDWINLEQIEADLGPNLVLAALLRGHPLRGLLQGRRQVDRVVPGTGVRGRRICGPHHMGRVDRSLRPDRRRRQRQPWCFSVRHTGANDGWVATDWFEDVMLRTAPPETYQAWIDHEIPFNDPEVLEAAELHLPDLVQP